jgi:hypothetical protein
MRTSIVDEDDVPLPTWNSDVEADVKELLGLFDLPAFARRGQDLEHALKRMDERCWRARGLLLEMVHLRLQQWAGAVTGPDGWRGVFVGAIEPLWALSDAKPPRWAHSPAPRGRQRAIAADLVAAVLRFNRRWVQFIDDINLDPINFMIEQYNRNYVLEKECVMGSARLAARHFVPLAVVTTQSLLQDHCVLPVPELAVRK